MNQKKPLLATDQQARLEEACQQLMAQENFQPESKEELEAWANTHMGEIINLAIANQERMVYSVLGDQEMMQKVNQKFSKSIYQKINDKNK